VWPRIHGFRYDVQSWVAELADAGCEAITLGVEPDGDEDDVQELITLCKELDVLGVPMRYRLGLRFDRGADDWTLLGS
jgi:pentose-5-phosphate-3-epimerase